MATTVNSNIHIIQECHNLPISNNNNNIINSSSTISNNNTVASLPRLLQTQCTHHASNRSLSPVLLLRLAVDIRPLLTTLVIWLLTFREQVNPTAAAN